MGCDTGLTETSPTCFNAYTHDTIERRLTTVGVVLPHTHAKIIDQQGCIVPIGIRGELCIAGYSLQRGYWKNWEKTAEVMIRDEHGVLWFHTGDEASIDKYGYCSITGRLKDIIITGQLSRLGRDPELTREILIQSRRREHLST